MLEFFKHLLGICGEPHVNFITLLAGSPVFLATLHYIKCKCGGLFNHKKTCNHENKN